jgi:hypothetical protein
MVEFCNLPSSTTCPLISVGERLYYTTRNLSLSCLVVEFLYGVVLIWKYTTTYFTLLVFASTFLARSGRYYVQKNLVYILRPGCGRSGVQSRVRMDRRSVW